MTRNKFIGIYISFSESKCKFLSRCPYIHDLDGIALGRPVCIVITYEFTLSFCFYNQNNRFLCIDINLN